MGILPHYRRTLPLVAIYSIDLFHAFRNVPNTATELSNYTKETQTKDSASSPLSAAAVSNGPSVLSVKSGEEDVDMKTLMEENTQLLQKMVGLQKENWTLEEKVEFHTVVVSSFLSLLQLATLMEKERKANEELQKQKAIIENFVTSNNPSGLSSLEVDEDHVNRAGQVCSFLCL